MSPRAAWRLESMGFAQVYDYAAGKLDWLAAGLPSEGSNARRPRAGDVARRDVPTCGLDERLGEVARRVWAAGWDACVVVNRPHVPIAEMARFMVDHDLDSSPITTSDGRLVGLLRRQDATRVAGEPAKGAGSDRGGGS